jgi:Rrf2 family protein
MKISIEIKSVNVQTPLAAIRRVYLQTAVRKICRGNSASSPPIFSCPAWPALGVVVVRLNQTLEYGLRAAAQLAISPPGVFVNAAELSEATGIPRHYVSKVVRQLVEHGLVLAQKGHGGGFRLANRPHETRFLDVLLALGYDPDAERCVFGWPRCSMEKPCPLHTSWSEMKDAFCDWARETTLADTTASSQN